MRPLSSRWFSWLNRFVYIPLFAVGTVAFTCLAIVDGGLFWIGPFLWGLMLLWSLKWCSEIHHLEIEGHILEFTDFKKIFRRDADEILDVRIGFSRPPSIIVSFVPRPDHPQRIRFLPKRAAFALSLRPLEGSKNELLNAKQSRTGAST